MGLAQTARRSRARRCTLEEMGFGWTSHSCIWKRSDTITSGFEGAWTANPTNGIMDISIFYLDMNGKQVTTPAGAIVWHAVGQKDEDIAPDAEDASVKVPTMMTTADMAFENGSRI